MSQPNGRPPGATAAGEPDSPSGPRSHLAVASLAVAASCLVFLVLAGVTSGPIKSDAQEFTQLGSTALAVIAPPVGIVLAAVALVRSRRRRLRGRALAVIALVASVLWLFVDLIAAAVSVLKSMAWH